MRKGMSFSFILILLGGALFCGVFISKQYYSWTDISKQPFFIEGCKYFNPEEVRLKIEQAKTENEYLNLEIIQKYIVKLPWIKDCNVRYHLTSNKSRYKHNSVWVHVKEKTPIAKTFNNSILLEDGTAIEANQVLFMSKLIKLNAVQPTQEILFFINSLSDYPILKKYIEACYYVRPGRWNIILAGKNIKLSEDFAFSLKSNNNQSNTKNRTYENLENLKTFILKHTQLFQQSQIIDLRKPGYAIIE